MTTISTATRPEAISDRLPDYGLFVECLATRNNAAMHGFWIDIEKIDDIRQWDACLQYVLATSPQPLAEEWEVTDTTCPKFLAWATPLQRIEWFQDRATLAGDEAMQEAFEEYCSDLIQPVSVQTFEEAFIGFYDGVEDFAASYYEERGTDFHDLENYIDWERVWEGEFHCNGYTYATVTSHRRNRSLPSSRNAGSWVAIFKPV